MATRPLYTKLLWDGTGAGAGIWESDPVPAGTIWVIRDITIQVDTAEQAPDVRGFTFFRSSDNVPIWKRAKGYIHPNCSMHFAGRQVLVAVDQIALQLFDLAWSWSVSGYELTAP